MKLRPAATRGYIPHNRLGEDNFESYRSFDFEGYKSGIHLNWGPIMTINDDRTDPGFITSHHEHKNLDILSYVVRGQVHHKDNLGNELQAQSGQVQHMSCGTGIWHTEGNTSNDTNRYLQIWITPNQILPNWHPEYRLITRDPNFSKLPLELKNTRIEVWAGNLNGEYIVDSWSYLLVLEGACTVGDFNLEEGDAIDITEMSTIKSVGGHLLMFKMI